MFNNMIGFYYFGYRFYELKMARWCNRDFLAERGGLNIYISFLNNPVSINDLFGLVAYEPVDGDYENVLDAIRHLEDTARNIYGMFDDEEDRNAKQENVVEVANTNGKMCCGKKRFICTVTLQFRNISTEGSILLYNWKSPTQDTTAQKLFDAVYQQISAHEMGHFEIWRLYADKLTRSYSATSIECSPQYACLIADSAARQKYLDYWNQLMNDFEQAEERYHNADYAIRKPVVTELIDEYNKLISMDTSP